MKPDLLDLYGRASEWTLSKVAGATERLNVPTPCDEWDVRTLMNHMLDTQHYFMGTGQGKEVALPSPAPPALLGADPVADFEQARDEMLRIYAEGGVIEKTGPSLGIAFSDQLLHGWDLATATEQDATMPAGLPEAAFEMLHGRLTDEQRKGAFKPEIAVSPDASAQAKLLAYTGRNPSG